MWLGPVLAAWSLTNLEAPTVARASRVDVTCQSLSDALCTVTSHTPNIKRLRGYFRRCQGTLVKTRKVSDMGEAAGGRKINHSSLGPCG